MNSRVRAKPRHCGNRYWGARAVVGLALVGLTSCGISNDSSPRDIGEADQLQLVAEAAQAAGTTSGSDRIYLLAPETANEPRKLRASTRDVGDSATLRLQSLFDALTVTDTSDRLRTAIPDGLQLMSAVVRTDGVVVVSVTDELLGLSRSSLVDAVAQIVFTSSEVEGVRSIDLRVDGQSLQWPAGDGELQSRPLTVYDYPGFIESTQPNFPAVPSPGA